MDQKETIFGIRTAVFDPDKGFVLNSKPYPIYGVCNRQEPVLARPFPMRCRRFASTS